MSEHSTADDNITRLLSHLDDHSLAARLVRAFRDPGMRTPAQAMMAILDARIEQLRDDFDRATD
jgi:hypothetical protein